MEEALVPRIPLESVDVPVMLGLVDGERTSRELAQMTDLPLRTVNSVLDRLVLKRLVQKSQEEVRGQFVEPRYALADGSAALATVHANLADNPLPLLMSLLQAARAGIPRAVAAGGRAGVWYSRLELSPDAGSRLAAQLEETVHAAETLQGDDHADVGAPSSSDRRYHVLVAYYEDGPADGAALARP
jgi:DNA-binding MarR family transcriptional regulator